MSIPFHSETKDYREYLFGGIVFAVSLVVYLMTVQRTLSLWDCGEFIACSYTLGVAHPPGTPLFLLLGRIFSILPVVGDISLRVNLLSVLTGAAAATVAYLVSVRLLFFVPRVVQDSAKRLAVYLCSMTGALLFAFSRTNWLNSVEAEVYSISMMLIFLLIWLSLRWYDLRAQGSSDKYLVLIAYLGLLSIGIHMTVFLVMPAIFLFVVLIERSLLRDARFWISAVLLFSVQYSFTFFVVGLLGWLLLSILAYSSNKSKQWALAIYMSAAGLVGYSVHGYIPIRAAQEPYINENNPQTWDSFLSYVGRKQYGQKSMITKMFDRRASWANQFGDFPRMGFGSFLVEQYGMTGIFFLIPVILSMIGIIGLIRWKWKIGLYVVMLLLLFTVALVLYMNFADGSVIDQLTANDKLEVRDRDYFFTPGFVFIGLLIGIGVFMVVNYLVSRMNNRMKTTVVAIIGVISLFMPARALIANFDQCNRSNNFFTYDYAYNLLVCCPQDAILFTNGDNDTFPVWCLQEVYGIRKDVRVVNLSLIQTDWYQLQMKHQLGVPISLEDDQMIWHDYPEGRGGQIVQRPARPYTDHLRDGWVHYLTAYQDPETGQLISVAHQMVEIIIGSNNWKYPIVFANSYPSEVKYPLAEHVKRRGFLWEIVPEKSHGEFDIEVSLDLLENKFLFRGLDDPSVYHGSVATSLNIGACQTLIEFANYIASTGDTATAVKIVDLMIEKIPEYWNSYERKVAYLGLDSAAATEVYDSYEVYLDSLMEHNPDNIYYYQYRAILMQITGRLDQCEDALKTAYRINRAISITYRSLLAMYLQTNRRDDAIRISKEFLKTNPYDEAARTVSSGRF